MIFKRTEKVYEKQSVMAKQKGKSPIATKEQKLKTKAIEEYKAGIKSYIVEAPGRGCSRLHFY